jgi:hypothetical protein
VKLSRSMTMDAYTDWRIQRFRLTKPFREVLARGYLENTKHRPMKDELLNCIEHLIFEEEYD